MSDLQEMEERSVLRWGGLAGILGSALLILVFGIVTVFVGTDPVGPEESVMSFPDIRAARTVENVLYRVVLVLWVIHFLALYRALRGRLAPALFGSALGIVGLVVLAAGALPHVATAPISDLYHAPGASIQDQATLVLMWQATQGMLDALLLAGLFILPMGLVALGVAMLGTPAFGRGLGRASVALGAVGVTAATTSVVLLDDVSGVAVVGALIAFHLLLGWKAHRLSMAPRSTSLTAR
ncbi:MAG TPA: hypothetical protein VK875_05025 [Euzebyales bacterium]|nr:hypothetical protein [Euzebyales bacterium]